MDLSLSRQGPSKRSEGESQESWRSRKHPGHWPEYSEDTTLSSFLQKNGENIIFKDVHHRSSFEFDLYSGMIPVETHVSSPHIDAIGTLDLGSITSESQAIDHAHIVFILELFTGEPALYLTIRGRVRSGSFPIVLPEQDALIKIGGVQIGLLAGSSRTHQRLPRDGTILQCGRYDHSYSSFQ